MMQKKNQFYFKTPELSHRYELILHLLEYSNHLILVEGDKDTGKSSLFTELDTPDESSLILKKLSATAHTTENDILNALVSDMNASTDNFDPWGVSVDDFNQWLTRCQSKQQIPALLIDDVDMLGDELVEHIFNVLGLPKDDAILHICLFCEPSFLELAKDKGLEESEARSLHIIEMPNFNEKQTAQYINHKYPGNESGLSVFDEKTVKQIHRISHGMPGRINVLAEQYLNDPAKQVPEIDKNEASSSDNLMKRNRPIIIVGMLLLILSTGVTFLLYKTDDAETPQQIKLELPQTPVVEPLEIKPLQTEVEVEAIPAEEPEPPAIEELTPPVIPQLAADVQLDNKIAKSMPLSEQEAVLENTDIEIQESQVKPEMESADADIDAGVSADKPGPVLQQDLVEIGVDVNPESEAQQISVQTELLITDLTKPDVAAPAKELSMVSAEVQQTDNTKAATDKNISWLLQQDPNHYVLQLIGAHEKQTIDDYLRRFSGADDKIIQFSTINNGKPWHVLVYGLYKNRQEAVTAIEQLSEQARKMEPWPRTVKSIQDLDIN